MSAPTDPNLHILTYPDGRRVLHLGGLGPLPKDGDMTKTHHLGAYTDGAVNVPAHWWNAQVTDRTNCPIVIRRSPAQIVAANRMFPFGNTGCPVPPQPKRVPFTDMGSSNVTIGMPITGERADIGLVTDNSGYFMLGFSPAPMIDWAQSAGSCPMHFRDEATGKPIDLLKYPRANAYDGAGYQGSPWLPKGPPNPAAPTYSQFGGGWVPQQAHYCEMSYLAYQATLDAGFLEDLQYSANFTVLTDGGLSNKLGKATIHGEYRGVAWAFRNLFMAHVSTLDAEAAGTLPASCHPSSYWKTLLDQSLAYYSKSMTDPTRQVFRLVSDLVSAGTPTVPAMATWQCDYMLTALAFGVLTGHSDWVPLYLWALGNVIDRTSGASGYPPGFGGAYYLNGSSPDWKTAYLDGIPGLGGAEPATPAEIAALTKDPLNGGIALRGRDYLMETRAALVMAQYVHLKGLADVKAVYPSLDVCVTNVDRMLQKTKPSYMNPRVSVVLDATQVPTTIPPLPTLPPAGAIHMGKPFTVQVGQSVDLPITWDNAGNPALEPATIAVSATPTGLVGLQMAPDGSSVKVTGVAVGTPLLQVVGQGATALSDTSQGTVTPIPLPPATAIHLNA